MQDRSKPTAAQLDYARKLLQEAGYDRYDVMDMYGKDFDALTRGEMARLIDDMRGELGYE